MTTGERIKQLRLQENLTQEELGAKVGVNKAAINKYETGVVENLKRSMIEKLALALNTTPTYIMGWEEKPTVQSNDGLSDKQRELISAVSDLPDDVVSLLLSAAKDWLSNRKSADSLE